MEYSVKYGRRMHKAIEAVDDTLRVASTGDKLVSSRNLTSPWWDQQFG